MPPKENDNEELNLDTINPNFESTTYGKIKDTNIRVIDYEKEKRINNLHVVIHVLAFMIIIPFIFMTVLKMEIPSTYSTIVSLVIGFYFGKALFDTQPLMFNKLKVYF